MKKIRCITYPKSGQHLLFESLLKYFSGDINYNAEKRRDNDGQVIRAGEMVFCEKGLHCSDVPCSCPETNFQIMHDTHILPENDPTANYIFLYRHPLMSTFSYYNYGEDLDADTCLELIEGRINDWKRWVHKWIINNNHSSKSI